MNEYEFCIVFDRGHEAFQKVVAESEKAGHAAVWNGLSLPQRDAVESIECIDVREVAA